MPVMTPFESADSIAIKDTAATRSCGQRLSWERVYWSEIQAAARVVEGAAGDATPPAPGAAQTAEGGEGTVPHPPRGAQDAPLSQEGQGMRQSNGPAQRSDSSQGLVRRDRPTVLPQPAALARRQQPPVVAKATVEGASRKQTDERAAGRKNGVQIVKSADALVVGLTAPHLEDAEGWALAEQMRRILTAFGYRVSRVSLNGEALWQCESAGGGQSVRKDVGINRVY